MYSLWRFQDLLFTYDLLPPPALNNDATPDPESARIAPIDAKSGHLPDRLVQITSGIPLIDFFAGAHEKEQLLTDSVALYSQIIDQSIWKDSNLLTTYYLGRGHAYSDLGQHQKALADFNQTISCGHNDPNGLLNRAYEYEIMGQPEQALSDLELFCRGQPTTLNFGSFIEKTHKSRLTSCGSGWVGMVDAQA